MFTIKLKRLSGKIFTWHCTSEVEVTARLTNILAKFPDARVTHDCRPPLSEWLVIEDNRPIMSEWCMPERTEPYR